MRNIIFFMVAVIFMLSACQTTKMNLESFHGKTKAYLVGRLGPPDAKEADDKGGEIWIYQEKEVYVRPGSVITYKQKTSDRIIQRKEKRVHPPEQQVRIINSSFYIDKKGIIYDTAYGYRDIVH
jgi:hypothetical protein